MARPSRAQREFVSVPGGSWCERCGKARAHYAEKARMFCFPCAAVEGRLVPEAVAILKEARMLEVDPGEQPLREEDVTEEDALDEREREPLPSEAPARGPGPQVGERGEFPPPGGGMASVGEGEEFPPIASSG